MQFHERETMHQVMRRQGRCPIDPNQFYNEALTRVKHDRDAANQMRAEWNWTAARRPYYSVWPAVIPMLTRLNLAVDSGCVQLPLNDLLVRLPKENNPLVFESAGQKHAIKTILASHQKIHPATDLNALTDGMGLWLDFGEVHNNMPIFTFVNYRLTPGKSLEDDLKYLPAHPSMSRGISVASTITTDCIRLVCTIALIADDPDLIKPDVLSNDRAKYDQTGDQKYVDKARRRGKVGWNIGEGIEQCPHYRRPHLGLRWTGPGSLVPKIVPIKGAIVNRQRASAVPTGYLDDEEAERTTP